MRSHEGLVVTPATEAVVRAFLASPGREIYGRQICEATQLPSGTVHPILARLERAGWVASRWGEVDPERPRVPVRRYYRVTIEGLTQGRRAVEKASGGQRGGDG